MLSSAIHAERDRLDHQRWRIVEILHNQTISAEMEQHLRHRLAYITQRLMELDLPPTTLRGYYQLFGSGPGQSNDTSIGGVNQYLGPLILARTFDPAKPYKTAGNGAAVRVQPPED